MNKKKSEVGFFRKTSIQVALIALLGTIGAALVTNYFTNKKNELKNDAIIHVAPVSDTSKSITKPTTKPIKNPDRNITSEINISLESSINKRLCDANSFVEGNNFDSAIKIYRDIYDKNPQYFSKMSSDSKAKIKKYRESKDYTDKECYIYKDFFLNTIKCE